MYCYRGHFVLDKYARGKMRVERVGISIDVTGSANLHSKANMDRQANEVIESNKLRVISSCKLYCSQEMERVMQALIHRIQTIFHCVVVRLATAFVQDANGRVWFLYCEQCLCASERQLDRSVY